MRKSVKSKNRQIGSVIVSFCAVGSIIAMIFYAMSLVGDVFSYSETYVYSVSEVYDGCYGIYTKVSSNVPANNYEMITACINNRVETLEGDVNIYYVDDEFKLIWTDTNVVHGDTIDLYIPTGSIEYSGGVGIGSGTR